MLADPMAPCHDRMQWNPAVGGPLVGILLLLMMMMM
jgi:hypothetical protein